MVQEASWEREQSANELSSSPLLVLDLPTNVKLLSETLPQFSGYPGLGRWLRAIWSNSGTLLRFSLLGFPSLSGEAHRHILTLGQVLLASPSCASPAEISRLLSLAAEEILVWQHDPTSGCLARQEMETSLRLRLCLALICLFGSPDSWAAPPGLVAVSDEP